MRFFALQTKRGFSIIELCFALLITSIVLALTFSNLKYSVEQEGPRSLAFSLASDIRAARAEAQKSGRLVAVCFPSDGKTNSLSKSMVVRRGDQRGKVLRINRYGAEFDASIFLGQWTSPPETKIEDTIPDAWGASVSDELAIFFRPDGSAFSRDLFPVDGRFPVVVASAFAGNPVGANGTLTQANNPNTIWISSSGIVEVAERKAPVDSLVAGGTELPVAELNLASGPGSAAPQFVSAEFLPKKIDDLSAAHVGQNYISIHPEQKEGDFLEYGLATIELKVRDADGGPLHYVLRANATDGTEGEFAVPDRKGPMRYVFDEDLNEYVWYALISWRPPPAAPEGAEYELIATVTDPDGNTLEVTSNAGLLPLVVSLPPSRLVMNTVDNELFLTNLDGANEIHLTKDGEEYSPFFSADGSHIFSFHNLSGSTKQLRRRTAAGTTLYDPLCDFDGTSTNVKFDPTFTFAAITAPNGSLNFPWGRVDEDTETSTDAEGNESTSTTYTFVNGATDVGVSRIFLVNLMSNDLVPISANAKASVPFHWNMLERHSFYFEDVVPTDFNPSTAHAPGPYRDYPGHTEEDMHRRLNGYPSIPIPYSGPRESAHGKIFNPADRNWYLEVTGGNLIVRNHSTGDVETIDSGTFENDPDTHRTPTWSALGTEIAYIKTSGSDRQLLTREILESDLSGILSSRPIKFNHSASSLQRAQLSPRGQWVYFLSGQSVFRSENGASVGVPANVSSHLGADVKNYVLSP